MRPLYVVIDTETTGLGHIAMPRRADAIVQVGLAWMPLPGKIESWATYCRPPDEFFADGRAVGALTIHGITREALTDAPPLATAAGRLRILLQRLGNPPLRAYNVAFDQPFLEAKPWSLKAAWGPCIMLEAHRMIDPRGKWPKLVEACAHFGVDLEAAHDAASDATAALLLAEKMRHLKNPPRPPSPPPPQPSSSRDAQP